MITYNPIFSYHISTSMNEIDHITDFNYKGGQKFRRSETASQKSSTVEVMLSRGSNALGANFLANR